MRSISISALLLCSLVPALAAAPSKTPIEKHLAGYSLTKSGQVALKDRDTGVYLIRSGE